jgi:DNA-binding NtrC family response regulator
VGGHPSVKRINDFIKLVSRARFAPCLISGESGSGKTLCAQLIHHANDLHDDLFFIKDCEKATTNELLGDLFGVDDESGIYGPKRRGLLEVYTGGTIVLQNIEKMPPDVQDKLLLYLEDKIFRPLGSNRIIESSVRIIAMSTYKLDQFVKRRDFNPDLFFHLNAFEISLPPLRERGEDILLLSDYYLQFAAQILAKPVHSLSLPVQRLLKEYAWPGNIRELKLVLEQAVMRSKSREIGLDDLPEYINGGRSSSSEDNHLGNCSLKEIERLHIERVLANTNGNKSKAAALLQISRTTLREKLKQYAID